jgi:hypothetical protein
VSSEQRAEARGPSHAPSIVEPLPGIAVAPPAPPGSGAHRDLFAPSVRLPERKPGALPLPGLQRDAEGGYVYRDSNFSARIAPDGQVELHDKGDVTLLGEGAQGNQAMFGFDLGDLAMKAAGDDPYRADKAKFMAQTRAFRQQLCDQNRKEELQRALWDLKRDLAAIWREEHGRVAEVKRRVFDLWDTCAEDGDADQLKLSAMARATIVAFIRERLPAGGPDAFGPEELIALNARRRSKRPFAPYN